MKEDDAAEGHNHVLHRLDHDGTNKAVDQSLSRLVSLVSFSHRILCVGTFQGLIYKAGQPPPHFHLRGGPRGWVSAIKMTVVSGALQAVSVEDAYLQINQGLFIAQLRQCATQF